MGGDDFGENRTRRMRGLFIWSQDKARGSRSIESIEGFRSDSLSRKNTAEMGDDKRDPMSAAERRWKKKKKR